MYTLEEHASNRIKTPVASVGIIKIMSGKECWWPRRPEELGVDTENNIEDGENEGVGEEDWTEEEVRAYENEVLQEIAKEARVVPEAIRVVRFISCSAGRRRRRKCRDVVLVVDGEADGKAFSLKLGQGGDLRQEIVDMARRFFPDLDDTEAIEWLLRDLGLDPKDFL